MVTDALDVTGMTVTFLYLQVLIYNLGPICTIN